MYSFGKVRKLIKQARAEMKEEILKQITMNCFIDCQKVDKIINLIKSL